MKFSSVRLVVLLICLWNVFVFLKFASPTPQPSGTTRMDPVSSIASSPISMDEIADQPQDEEPSSPRAPLAVQISITSGPTPTPSSAAMTISVDGFFEPPYGRHPQDSLLHPPHLPLSPSDESFPVFSPPPAGGKSSAGVQTDQPLPRGYLPPLHSPALSHHTCILD